MILKKGEGEEHIDLRSFDTNGDGVGPNLESRTFDSIPDGILQYKGFKILPDGTTDYGNSTINRQRVNGKWTDIEYAEEDAKITTKNKVTLKKLKSKKTVQVKARAFVKVNGEKHYGAWSKAIKSKKIK